MNDTFCLSKIVTQKTDGHLGDTLQLFKFQLYTMMIVYSDGW